MNPPDDDLWEEHAGWWQSGFPDGADPEYEEQIIPLAREHLAGVRRVLDVGTGEGQLARLVDGFARQLGGRVERQSDRQGTTVHVILPSREGV